MSYQSDITQEEFKLIEHLLPQKKVTKPRKHSLLEIFNAILYVLITGCQWRQLPNDLPNWKTVYNNYNTWSKLEIFDEMLKKTLSPLGYKRAKINIQLYCLQIPKVPNVQTNKIKVK
jgi:transposase